MSVFGVKVGRFRNGRVKRQYYISRGGTRF